jgi:small subunit ribosomal protein S6
MTGGKSHGKEDKRLVRIYELVFIVNPEVEGEELDGAVASVTRLIERGGGSVLKLDPWGLRRMAYSIQDHREGYYFLMYVEMDPLAVTEFESSMSLVEPVLRYLMVLPQGEVKFAAPASEEPVEQVEPASDDISVPDEGEAEVEVEEAAASDESTEQPEA